MYDDLINPAETLMNFVYATKNSDITRIKDLLDDEGVFEIEQISNVLVDVNKEEFLEWYQSKLHETKIEEVDYDYCAGCSCGERVILFNNGRFPRKTKEPLENFKSGLRFKFDGNMISKISFCIHFLKTENKLVHECQEENINEEPNINFNPKVVLDYDNDDVLF